MQNTLFCFWTCNIMYFKFLDKKLSKRFILSRAFDFHVLSVKRIQGDEGFPETAYNKSGMKNFSNKTEC